MLKGQADMFPFSYFRQRREGKEARIVAALRDGELSGYQIHVCTRISIGGLYVTLDRMERDGRLTSRWGVATKEHGWRRPRLYKLSDSA